MAFAAFARVVLCSIGCILSLYAYHVETAKNEDALYQAMCDLSETISCSAVFASKYGKGFGIVGRILGDDNILNQPNSVYGLIFYSIQMIGLCVHSKVFTDVLYWMTALGILVCFYLAYILAFVLHDFCIVCVFTYGLSFGLHVLNHWARKELSLRHAKKKK